MTGKTHAAVGTAVTLVLTQPSSFRSLVLCLSVAQIGAVISDIDVSSSRSHKQLNQVLKLLILAITVTALIEVIWNIGILSSFETNSTVTRILLGIASFILICIYGESKPHRSFMHSFLAVFILSASVYIILPIAVPYFAISMLSHIVIDMLNRKKVKFLYPSKRGVSLSLCSANGIVNTIFFYAGTVVSVFVTIFFIIQFQFNIF